MSNLTRESIREDLAQRLSQKSEWKALAGSLQTAMYVEALADIALKMEQRVSRAEIEKFSLTAIDRATVLAAAAEKLYIPRKPLPAAGKVLVKNTTSKPVDIPYQLAMVSEKQVPYVNFTALTVPPGGTAILSDFKQVQFVTRDFTIQSRKPFYELLLSQEDSKLIHELDVLLDQGSGFQEWKLYRRFRNASRTDPAWEETYAVTDQVGIRFGNGIFGRIPDVNSKVQIKLQMTLGNTTLLPGAKLFPVDNASEYAGLEFTVDTAVAGGLPQEDIESIRINALYSEQYNDEYVWENDYAHKLKGRIPQITWIKIWGEKQQEKLAGKLNVEHINKTYISAVAPGVSDLGAKIIKILEALPEYAGQYKFVAPTQKTFVVNIAGKLLRDVSKEDTKQTISKNLQEMYSIESSKRKSSALVQDIYRMLDGLKVFSAKHPVNVSITGDPIATEPLDLVHIDLATSVSAISLVHEND